MQPDKDINLNDALEAVVTGHLDHLEEYLSKKPELAKQKGSITDLSKRTYSGITILHYAIWSLDLEATLLIKAKLTPQEIRAQMAEMNTIKSFKLHQPRYSANKIIRLMEELIQNTAQWNEAQQQEFLIKKLAPEQQLMPAWLIYAFCERGNSSTWIEYKENKALTRVYCAEPKEESPLHYWFEKERTGLFKYFWRGPKPLFILDRPWISALPKHDDLVHDLSCIKQLVLLRSEQLKEVSSAPQGEINIQREPKLGFFDNNPNTTEVSASEPHHLGPKEPADSKKPANPIGPTHSIEPVNPVEPFSPKEQAADEKLPPSALGFFNISSGRTVPVMSPEDDMAERPRKKTSGCGCCVVA